MDALYDRMRSPRTLSDDDKSTAGRLTDLKTYLVENNSELHQEVCTENLQINIDQTGLDDIKILTLTDRKKPERHLQFYLDKTDARFPVFHTFELAKNTNPMMTHMINSSEMNLDNAWLSTGLLRSISNEFGNIGYGYDVRHKDYFRQEADDTGPIKPDGYFRMSVYGSRADKILRLLLKDEDVSGLISCSKVRVGRGTKGAGIVDDLYYNGRFNVVEGDSIEDHIILVNMVKERYAALIRRIEDCRIYYNKATRTLEGRPLGFWFNRKVDDWEHFLAQMFNSKEPFGTWGIENKIDDGYYKILAVDVHTGHPFDMEIADGFFRVYLPENSYGNLIVRLFVNLQRFFDSQISCPDIEAK